LHQDIENVAVLINGAPQISPFTSNGHDVNLIQVPGVSKWASTFFDLSSIHWAKFVTPTADSFIGNNNPALGQKIFDITETHREPEVEPNGLPDNVGVKAVTSVGKFLHRADLPRYQLYP
jgi:hypothetical protein